MLAPEQNDFNSNSSSRLDDASLDSHDPILFYPLNNFLSFPSIHKRNSIGVTVWLFFVNRSMEIFLNKFHSGTYIFLRGNLNLKSCVSS